MLQDPFTLSSLIHFATTYAEQLN